MRYNNRYEWQGFRIKINKMVQKGITSYRGDDFEFKIRDIEPIKDNRPSEEVLEQIKIHTRVEMLNQKICKVIPSRLNFEKS